MFLPRAASAARLQAKGDIGVKAIVFRISGAEETQGRLKFTRQVGNV